MLQELGTVAPLAQSQAKQFEMLHRQVACVTVVLRPRHCSTTGVAAVEAVEGAGAVAESSQRRKKLPVPTAE